LAFAHRALASAASRLRPAALIFLLGFAAALADFAPRRFAHRALAAAAIFALAAALIFLRLGAPSEGAFAIAPNIRPSSLCSDSILSLIAAALRSCLGDNVVSEFISAIRTHLAGGVNDYSATSQPAGPRVL
jgi:hypothetical protein